LGGKNAHLSILHGEAPAPAGTLEPKADSRHRLHTFVLPVGRSRSWLSRKSRTATAEFYERLINLIEFTRDFESLGEAVSAVCSSWQAVTRAGRD
jgi:hypothetical protein